MALRPTRETAQTTPVPAAVPSSTRLDCSLHLGAAPEGAYLLEDRAATRSFSCLSQ